MTHIHQGYEPEIVVFLVEILGEMHTKYDHISTVSFFFYTTNTKSMYLKKNLQKLQIKIHCIKQS